MISDLLNNPEFQKLEKEYKFLSRAREHIYQLERERFVILDTETTGLEPDDCEIIEIAAMKVDNGEIKDIFNQLLKPEHPISEEITRITGITNELVEGCPALQDVTAKFLKFIEGSTLIMHNAEFDLGFINKKIFAPRKRELKNNIICTLKVSRFLMPQFASHKLSKLAAHFKIQADNSHRALGDVETTYQVWRKFIPMLREKGIYTLEDLRKAIP